MNDYGVLYDQIEGVCFGSKNDQFGHFCYGVKGGLNDYTLSKQSAIYMTDLLQ